MASGSLLLCFYSNHRCHSCRSASSPPSSPPGSSDPGTEALAQFGDEPHTILWAERWTRRLTGYDLKVSIMVRIWSVTFLWRNRRTHTAPTRADINKNVMISVRHSYSVLWPETAKLKPVSLTVVAMPWSVILGAGPSSLGLKSLKISGGQKTL